MLTENKPQMVKSYRSRTWSDSNNNIRVAIIGAARVGKTTIVHQYLYQQFAEEYMKTQTDVHYKRVSDVDIDILDSGHLESPELRKIAIKNAHVFILVFTLEDKSSFDFMIKVRNEIIEMKGHSTPYIVVGNKTDIEGNRCVDHALADCLVSIEWETAYCEISAKEANEVTDVFNTLFRLPSIQRKLSRECSRVHFRKNGGNIRTMSENLDDVFLSDDETPLQEKRGKFWRLFCR